MTFCSVIDGDRSGYIALPGPTSVGTADYPSSPILAKECSGSAALPAFAWQYHGVRDPLNEGILNDVLRPLRHHLHGPRPQVA